MLILSETDATVSEHMYADNPDLERSKLDEDKSASQLRLQEFDGANPSAGLNILLQRMFSPWVRASHLPHLFCSWDLAYRCTKGGWLKPIVQGKRRTIYRLADVLDCMRRIEAGELPSARSSRNER